MIRKIGLPLAALSMLVFAVYHAVRAQQTPPPLDPPAQPARTPFGKSVAGAGLVEAQTENIAVGTNVPGVVTEVFVRVGQKVRKGERLFRLDDRTLKAEWKVRRAALDAAIAELDKLRQMPRPEEIPPLEARVNELRANLADQSDLARRARRLHATRAIGEEERNRREQAVSMAKAQLHRAEADLELLKSGSWKPELRVAETSVEQAKAMLAATETELERLQVNALVDGEVLQVNVRPGEFVATQSNTAPIVLGNVSCLHVRVDVDEHDIPRYDSSGKAVAMVRGNPKKEYPLRFVRIEPFVIPKKSLTGDNVERVDTRVLQVIYSIEDSSARVFVGQQLDVYVESRQMN